MSSFILYCIGMIISSYYMDVLLGFILKRKMKNLVNVFIYSILNLLHVFISDFIFESLDVKYISFYIINWMYICIFYKGTIVKKIIAYLELISAVLFTELIGTQIFCGMLGYTQQDVLKFTDIRIIINFICAILLAVLVYLYIFIQKKIKFSLSASKLKFILSTFMSQAIIGSIYNLILWKEGMDSSNVFIIYIFSVLIIDVWLLRSMSLLEIKEDTEEKIKNYEKENELISEYYSELSENINNLENIKNEYNNELKNIYVVTGKISEFEKVREEGDASHKESVVKKILSDTSNVLVDNIISNIKTQLDMLNVEYKIDVKVSKKLNIDYGDLSSVLINMFGNAVEAVELYVKDKKQNLSDKANERYYLEGLVCYDEKKIYIEVKNVKSPKQKIRMLDDKYITSKKEKNIHGYGMQIIKRIADKYDGKMEVEHTNNSFKNSVTLICK